MYGTITHLNHVLLHKQRSSNLPEEHEHTHTRSGGYSEDTVTFKCGQAFITPRTVAVQRHTYLAGESKLLPLASSTSPLATVAVASTLLLSAL
jgi:hypothetical protein